MGKKGVMLDNGKKAQSSMALYWKKHHQQSKHPKQKTQHVDERQDQVISDKRVMSNFQKWKMHKQKIITKAYTKPQVKQDQVKKAEKQRNDQQQEQLLQQMMERKKPKVVNVPGFKSKNNLASKMEIQKPKQADQSTNILKLPGHMSDLTQQQIVHMLKQRKNKQQMMKKYQNHKNNQHEKQNKQNQEDVLLGDQFIDLIKKKQIQNEKKQKQNQQKQALQAIKQPQPSYFKSQILNKIQKQGLQIGLQSTFHHLVQLQQKKQQKQLQNKKVQANNNQSQEKKHFQVNPKLIPRVLKK